MPYIDPQSRKKLDSHIDSLAKEIVEIAKKENYDGAFSGLINYSVTRLTLKVARKLFGKMRYWLVAIISGVFKNISDEFYRRLATPYEEKQIKKSGDVDIYKEYLDEIEKI